MKAHQLWTSLYEGSPLTFADIIDDFPDALAQWCVLDAELLDETAVVDHEVAGNLAAACFRLKANVGIGQKIAHDCRQLAHADGCTAGIVSLMLGSVRKQDASEYFRHILDVDHTAHGVSVRERDRVAARRLAHAVDVIDRAEFLVRSG